MDKLLFLKNDFVRVLSELNVNTSPIFGKMNVHQMIEHMSYAFRQASGFIPLAQLNDEETTAKMHRFMMSDKPFRDYTPNPYLPDMPPTAEYETVGESLTQLQKDIDSFIQIFENDKTLRIANPFFGNLDFNECVHLLYKHAQHHLRQFGVAEGKV